METGCNWSKGQQRQNGFGKLLDKALRQAKRGIRNQRRQDFQADVKAGRKGRLQLRRGEDIKPQTPEAEKALAILIHEYN